MISDPIVVEAARDGQLAAGAELYIEGPLEVAYTKGRLDLKTRARVVHLPHAASARQQEGRAVLCRRACRGAGGQSAPLIRSEEHLRVGLGSGMTKGLGRIERECLRMIEAREAAGERPTTIASCQTRTVTASAMMLSTAA
jgi:hypothetical protein